ncbi:di-heme oxidoredictase family protein [Engelhardtia mirabilis]|uniref:di-heme oxidoredictase family protein n=1 Tax=Engelhardtia mirabilis TaxID=2528011 RepID=UPI0011A71733
MRKRVVPALAIVAFGVLAVSGSEPATEPAAGVAPGDAAELQLRWSQVAAGEWRLSASVEMDELVAVALSVEAAGQDWRRGPEGGAALWADLPADGGRTLFACWPIWNDDGAGVGPTLVLGRRADGELPRIRAAAALTRRDGALRAIESAELRGNGLVTPLAVVAPDEPPPAPGEPVAGLDSDLRARFEAGRFEFDRQMTERDGLGPAFNDQSCFTCHRQPAAGGFSERVVTHFGRTREPASELRERGGPILQAQGVEPAAIELLPSEADVRAERISPHLFGIGLVELLPDEALVALAAAQPEAQRGRVHWVQPLEGGPLRAGRFGWKSQFATLLSFTADASLQELGQTNRLLPEELAPGGDFRVLLEFDRTPDPELRPDADGIDRLDRLVDFQSLLAPPPQTPRAGHPGEAIFERIGCAVCHQPRLQLPANLDGPLAGVHFAPYSDYLLHDLGAEADGIRTRGAEPTEMRTAPLWGLTGRRFLWHDGTLTGGTFESRVAAAIDRHAGQGEAARDRFRSLELAERRTLLEFLASLGRAAQDLTADGRVDGADGARFGVVLVTSTHLRGTEGTQIQSSMDDSMNGFLEPVELLGFVWGVARAVSHRASLAEPRR